ncbi:carboxypeptidase B isoform X1 [Plutella xylostella]|uniref:carboxypeptidase B isoform X1 n=2 Tax=Plutella xylostella TaxID=51655 RepID=UPI002032D084|nr:carboxypeptidase B isoform X1 [Plutella xylostella]
MQIIKEKSHIKMQFNSSKFNEDFFNTSYDDLSTMSFRTENSTQANISPNKGRCIPNYMKGLRHIEPRPKQKSIHVQYMTWKKYHRLAVVYAFLDQLEKEYPAICTVVVIGKSVHGRDIKMLKISNTDATNSGVWLDGCIHAREWITTSVVTYIANCLVTQFHCLPKYITNKDWHIVPVLNPDGYVYTHTKDRLWRKNRSKFKGGIGVDLNRNFSYGWGNNGDEGSSDDPSSNFYRGPEPFSEPESASVRDAILGSHSTFKVFLSFHSYFECIIFPWGYKVEPCPDYIKLLEGGIAMSRAIHQSTGKTYKVGSTKDLTYFACGTSTDWSYGVANIPYCYMVELRGRKHKFKLPREEILDTCVENWQGVCKLMEYVDKTS